MYRFEELSEDIGTLLRIDTILITNDLKVVHFIVSVAFLSKHEVSEKAARMQ